MRYDDEYDDYLGRPRARGVAAGWRVAAVLAFAVAAVLGMMLLAACVALLTRPRTEPGPAPQLPPIAFNFNPPADGPADDNEDDDKADDAHPLPYPTRQDLRPAGQPPPVAGEAPAPARPDPRERFLRAAEVVWTSDEPFGPDVVLVSPDGSALAYGGAVGLMVGRPPEAPQLVAGTQPKGGGGARKRPAGERPVVSEWWPDGTGLNWAAADGTLGSARLVPAIGAVIADPTDWSRGRYAVPIPPGHDQVVVVRHRPRPKLQAADRQGTLDPAEVVVGEPAKNMTRVLIPATTAVWRAPAVSPDGKRVALVSDGGHEAGPARLWRVFVLVLAGGEPRPLTPAAARVGTVCWAPDGKALVYARGAAHAAGRGGNVWRMDLFEADPDAGGEVPLTVGGGFSSPTVSRTGDLYALAQSGVGDKAKTELIRLPLRKARELAATLRPAGRDAKSWLDLAGAALRQAGLPADAGPSALDEDKVKKLAAAAATAYRERFGTALPDTAAELDRLTDEVRRLGVAPAEYNRLDLVLGAVGGEYLRRKHGARWALGAKPQGQPLADPEAHALFRHVVNPFAGAGPDERDDEDGDEPNPGSLAWALARAEGRPIVLARDPAVRTHVPAADPDLARGTALLKDGKGDEADRVLLALAERHAGSYHLALHLGALLSDHRRKAAVRDLARRQKADVIRDARVYNFVGVARLDDDPQAAIAAFKNALRCELYHGPAYFNLATAYEKVNDPAAARLCLRRYLKLMSWGPLADDARRRLGELPPEPRRR